MKQKYREVNKDLLFLISVCFVVALISFGIGILATVLFLPFPERFEIQYMDEEMIAEGEAYFLILIFLFGILSVISLIGSVVSSTLCCFFEFYNKTEFNPNNIKSLILSIGLMVFTICCSILPFVFIWFIPVINIDENVLSITNDYNKIYGNTSGGGY